MKRDRANFLRMFVLMFHLLFHHVVWAAEKMEASSCSDCDHRSSLFLNPVGGQIQDLKDVVWILSKSATPAKCAESSAEISPASKSVLENLGFEYDGSDPAIVATRAFITCSYGSGYGGLSALKDLVVAIPTLFGMSIKGLELANANNRELPAEVARSLTKENVLKMQDKLIVTKKTISAAYRNANDSLYEAYRQAGVSGAVAATMQAAYHSSPHHAMSKFLSESATTIARAIGTRWTSFSCLPVEKQAQIFCQVLGYLATDIFGGKIALSALGKSAKFNEMVQQLKLTHIRKPLESEHLLRHLKSVSESVCKSIPDGGWLVDAVLSQQGHDLEVFLDKSRVIARGLDPKTKKLGCFEVTGSLLPEVTKRIQSTRERIATVSPEIPSALERDFFSPTSETYARSNSDYVRAVNERVGTPILKQDIDKVANALASDPVKMELYGDIMRSADKLRTRAATMAKGSEDASRLLKNKVSMEDLLNNMNSTLSIPGAQTKINLNLIKDVVEEARLSLDDSALKTLSKALREVRSSAKSAGARDIVEAWEKKLRQDRPYLKDDEIARAKQCLFSHSPIVD